jgi:hypothetical protein
LFLEALRVSTVWKGMNLAFDGEHVGRKDQRLIGSVEKQGKFGGYFMWGSDSHAHEPHDAHVFRRRHAGQQRLVDDPRFHSAAGRRQREQHSLCCSPTPTHSSSSCGTDLGTSLRAVSSTWRIRP